MIEIILCSFFAVGYIYIFAKGIRSFFKPKQKNLEESYYIPYN